MADAWKAIVTEGVDVHAWSHKIAWALDADQAGRLECLWLFLALNADTVPNLVVRTGQRGKTARHQVGATWNLV